MHGGTGGTGQCPDLAQRQCPDGQNLQETALTTSNVNATTFGKLFVINVDGKVDAEPVYVAALAIPGNGTHNVLYVVTEHDGAYAFDADTGTELWHVTLVNGGETTSDPRNCSQVTPEIGITSTPAIDLHMGPHGTMYTVSMSKDGSGNYHQRLHALDLTTGAADFDGDGRPELIWQDPVTGTSHVWLMAGTRGTTFIGAVALGAATGWRIAK